MDKNLFTFFEKNVRELVENTDNDDGKAVELAKKLRDTLNDFLTDYETSTDNSKYGYGSYYSYNKPTSSESTTDKVDTTILVSAGSLYSKPHYKFYEQKGDDAILLDSLVLEPKKTYKFLRENNTRSHPFTLGLKWNTSQVGKEFKEIYEFSKSHSYTSGIRGSESFTLKISENWNEKSPKLKYYCTSHSNMIDDVIISKNASSDVNKKHHNTKTETKENFEEIYVSGGDFNNAYGYFSFGNKSSSLINLVLDSKKNYKFIIKDVKSPFCIGNILGRRVLEARLPNDCDIQFNSVNDEKVSFNTGISNQGDSITLKFKPQFKNNPHVKFFSPPRKSRYQKFKFTNPEFNKG